MSMAGLRGIPGRLKTLITNLATVDTNVDTLIARITATRAGNLDDVDVPVSTRASQTSITTLQSSVNTVDSVVDGIAADVAALPTGSVSDSYHSMVSGSASSSFITVSFGRAFDRAKSQVQISFPDPVQAASANVVQVRWFWASTSSIEVDFIDSAGSRVALGTSNTFSVSVVEFA